jgi:ferritin-like metal-binding protein YciE
MTMGLSFKDITSMDDLFVHQLQDIYYAEKRIVGALPDMIAKATSPELTAAFEAHLGQAKNHVKRVEQLFQMHGTQPIVLLSTGSSKRLMKSAAKLGARTFWTPR